MDYSTLLSIVFAIAALFMGVQWAVLAQKVQNASSKIKQFRDMYVSMTADGVITDEEKAKLVENAVVIINDAADIFQVVDGLWRKLVAIFKSKGTG